MAMAIAVSVLMVAGVSPVAAQGSAKPDNPGMVINSSTTYTVDAEAGSVSVDVEYVLLNDTSDTPLTEFSEVLPLDAKDIVVMAGTHLLGAVRVGTSGESGSWIIPLLTVLRPGRSVTVSLTYTLNSKSSGSNDSGIVINPAFVSLPIHASGSEAALHSVSVTLPSGFHVVDAPGLVVDDSAESLVLDDSGSLAPYSSVVLLATDKTMLASTALGDLGVAVDVRSWPGDSSWAGSISDASASIVTQMTEWFGPPPMDTIEVLEGSSTAYPDTAVATPVNGRATLVVDESADIGVLGRQLAVAWLGDPLPEIPWFGTAAVDTIGTAVARLHDPEAAGPNSDVPGFDQLAHDLVDSLFAEIGGEKLATVMSSVGEGAFTYPGPGSADGDPLPADWHTLLDSLRIEGGSNSAESLFRGFLTDPADLDAMDQHAIALASFAKLSDTAHGWQVPMWVRSPLAEWDFTTFEARRT